MLFYHRPSPTGLGIWISTFATREFRRVFSLWAHTKCGCCQFAPNVMQMRAEFAAAAGASICLLGILLLLQVHTRAYPCGTFVSAARDLAKVRPQREFCHGVRERDKPSLCVSASDSIFAAILLLFGKVFTYKFAALFQRCAITTVEHQPWHFCDYIYCESFEFISH
jgi:hypothetical protein